ncbi:MAG: hypothetical protein ACI4TZ_01590, partial [Christensenellales bacterium]
MQTKYPNKQKAKIVVKNAKNKQPVLTEVLNEQNYQIEELKLKSKKSDFNSAYFDAKINYCQRAYADLKTYWRITNDYAANAHYRIDGIEEQLKAIVTNGETNTSELGALNEIVTSNTNRIATNETQVVNTIANLHKVMTQHSQDVETLSTNISNLSTQHSQDIENLAIRHNQDVETLMGNIDNLSTQHSQDVEDISTDIANLSTQHSQDVENLSTNIASLSTDIANLTSQHNQDTNTLTDNISNLTNKHNQDVETLTTQINENKTRLDALEQNSNTSNNDEIESQISELSTQVASNTERLNVLEENVSNVDFENLQQTINTLTTQVEQNTEVIQDYQTTTENLQSACENIETEHQNLTKQNQNLQAIVNANTTDIQNLQNQVDINTAKIEILQNSGTSGGSSELDLVDLTEQVEQNTTDIANLQAQQNINTADIATLLAFKQRFTTPTDEHYCPKTYSDYPAGTIIQTYACYERELYLYNYNLITTPNAYFLAEAGSEGTIKITLDIKTDATTTQELLIEIYLNNNLISSQLISATPEIKTYNFTIYDTALNTETKQNTICCKIKPGSYNRFYLYHAKVELIAPNADIIEINKPYNVEYMDEKYYVSDCADGRAKLAVIKKDDMFNMESLNFEDKGYDAQSLVVGASTKSYESTYVLNDFVEIYTQKNNLMYYSSKINNTVESSSNYKNMDWLAYKTNNTKFVTSNANFLPRYALVYESNGSMGIGTLTSLATNVVRTYAVKYLGKLKDLISLNTFANITGDGQVVLTHANSTVEKFNINLGYGTMARVYYDYLTSTS